MNPTDEGATHASTLMVRYEIAEDGVDDVVKAVEAAFAAVNEQQPDGIRFSYWRRAGSTEFLSVLELDDDVENPRSPSAPPTSCGR